jgi:tol-pal system-associated acyl-CoA thioesterase
MNSAPLSQHSHQHLLRVYYEDTDAQAIVYNANYLKYMERGRTEMLRDIGFVHPQITENGSNYFVVGEVTARYKAPAKLDDQLIVETSVLNVGGASIKLRQNVLKLVATGNLLLLEGTVTLIYLAENGRPLRIPDELRKTFAPYIVQEESK